MQSSIYKSFNVSILIVKLVIPFFIFSEILQYFGYIEYVAFLFEPITSLLSLPPEVAIALATGFFLNIYAGIAVAAGLSLSPYEWTIVGTFIAICHSIPLEAAVMKKVGFSIHLHWTIRLTLAFLGAWVAAVFIPKELIGVTSETLVAPVYDDFGEMLTTAIVASIVLALKVIALVTALIVSCDFVRKIPAVDSLMDKHTYLSSLTIGGLLGITYGAGILLKDMESVDHNHKTYLLMFLLLAHGLIEETLIFALFGADVAVIFIIRVGIAVMAVLTLYIITKTILARGIDKEELSEMLQETTLIENKVSITDRIPDPDIEYGILGSLLSTTPDKDTTVLLVWHQVVNESYLDNFPNLKAIIRYGVGFDKIDLVGCKKRGIVVCNNPDYCTEEVSDTAVAMILNCSRKLSCYDDQARHYRSGWQENYIPRITRTSHQTVGLIGLGRTGARTLQSCQALRYQTQFYDPYLPHGQEKVFGTRRCNSLDELLSTSDIVSLHCPLNKETKDLVDAKFITRMKKGASLVNTARGQLVKNLNLIYCALKMGQLDVVGLDVLPQEPPQNDLLINAWRNREEWLSGRLVISPHAAYYSLESSEEQRRKAAETALIGIQQGEFRNVVNS